MQTNKITKQPIVLYDSVFWGGLLDWFKKPFTRPLRQRQDFLGRTHSSYDWHKAL